VLGVKVVETQGRNLQFARAAGNENFLKNLRAAQFVVELRDIFTARCPVNAEIIKFGNSRFSYRLDVSGAAYLDGDRHRLVNLHLSFVRDSVDLEIADRAGKIGGAPLLRERSDVDGERLTADRDFLARTEKVSKDIEGISEASIPAGDGETDGGATYR